METKVISLFFRRIYSFRNLSLVFATIFLLVNTVVAQNDSSSEKKEAKIKLSFYKNAEQNKTATAKVITLINDKQFPVSNTAVNFYLGSDKNQQLFKRIFTDNIGIAKVDLPKDLPLDANRYFSVAAKIENDSVYENTEDSISNKEVNLSMQLQKEDTAKYIHALVTETAADGTTKPVKDVEVKFYVQRMFGVLPLSDDNAVTTDENGEASFLFPKDIHGDNSGNLILVARIEESDDYGNVQSQAAADWGIPLVVDKHPFPRALWEPYAPPSLILVITILFGSVWSTYFFIFYQLRKIRQEAREYARQNPEQKLF